MKNKLNVISILLFGSIFISVFYRWFFHGDIVGGDWPYLFKESLENYHFLVPSWNAWQGNGLGGTNPIYFLQSFEYLTVSLANFLNIPWPFVYKIFWFGLFIALSILSSIYLLRTILSSAKLWQMGLSALIFTTNTYILMVVGGGQMGIALAYSIAPLVLASFIKLINSVKHNFKFPPALAFGKSRWRAGQISNFKFPIVAGLSLSLQVLFDPRLAYITIIAVTIYTVLTMKKKILNALYLILYTFVVPGIITLLLHVFWILPLLAFSQNTCERFCEAYSGVEIVKFLSFSTFSQSLSLLHPNWPENIFGKIGFMKPEFILLPILAYMSLFFLTIKQFNPVKIASQFNGASNTTILFFALLGIIGAFLAKGTNPPFGEVYLWLFENVPGFVLFRDSTKFYLLVALTYSVLIPLSLWQFVKMVSSIKYKASSIHNIYYIIPTTFLVVWAFLIHPAVLGQLGGTFKKHEMPKEYVDLKDFLYKQPEFFRTLWVPRQHLFTFFSNLHSSVEAGPLFNATNAAEAIKELRKTDAKEYLSELSVKYVIVPYDSFGEFFLTDRKYDSSIPEKISKSLGDIVWLKKIDGFGSLTVFEVPSPRDHFWLEKSGKISYKMINSTHYIVNVSANQDQKLIFSEKYNSSWIAKVGNKTINSEKISGNLNSFVLEKGDYDLEITFLQNEVYNYSRVISLAAFLGVLLFVFKYRKSNGLSN